MNDVNWFDVRKLRRNVLIITPLLTAMLFAHVEDITFVPSVVLIINSFVKCMFLNTYRELYFWFSSNIHTKTYHGLLPLIHAYSFSPWKFANNFQYFLQYTTTQIWRFIEQYLLRNSQKKTKILLMFTKKNLKDNLDFQIIRWEITKIINLRINSYPIYTSAISVYLISTFPVIIYIYNYFV